MIMPSPGLAGRRTAAVFVSAAVILVACQRATTAGGAAAGDVARPSPGLELREATSGDVLRAVRAPGASAVVVNVWATWCLPCREEFPDLMRVHRELAPRGLRLVLVSADFPDKAEAARAFLAQNGVDFPSYLKTGPDMEFIDGLSKQWTGALPATFVFDGAGNLREFWEGKTAYETLAAKVRSVLDTRG